MLPLITIAVHTLTIYTSLLTITNEYRAQNALAPLAVHPSLTRAASQQANTMCTRKSLVHNNLSGRLAAVDFVGARIGENIARSVENDEHRVFEVWLKSEMHRDNIVGDYEFVGEGKCVDGDGYFYYVEIFGRRARDTDSKNCGDSTSCGEMGARTGISAVKYDVPEQHDNTVKYNIPEQHDNTVKNDNGNTKMKRTIRLIIDRSSSNDNHPKDDTNTPNTTGYISSYGANTGYNTSSISYSDFLVYYDQFLKNYLSSLQTKDECTIKEINEKLKSIDGQLSRLLGRGNEREVNGGNDKCSGSCGVRGGGYEPVYDDNVKNVNDDKEGDKSRDNGKNVNDQNATNVNDDKEGDKSRDNGRNMNNDNGKNLNDQNVKNVNNDNGRNVNDQNVKNVNNDSGKNEDDTDINKINYKPENDNNSTGKNINKVNDRSENENKNGNKNTADEGDSNTSSSEKLKNDVRVPIVVSDKKNENRRNVLLINLKDLLGNIPNISNIDENTNNDKGNGEMATNTQQNKGPDNGNDDENGDKANDKDENDGSNTKNSTKSKDDQNASAKNGNHGEINMGSDVKGLAEILERLKGGKKTENSNVDPENGKESAGQSNDKHEMDDDLRFVIKIGNNGIENENEINKLISVLKKIAEGKDTPTNEGGDKNKQGESERQNEDGKNKQEESDKQNGDDNKKPEQKDNGDKNKQGESERQNGDGKKKTEEKDNGDKNKQEQAEKQNKENENDETGKELILKELISLIGKLERIRTGESAKDLKKEEQSENKPEILNWVKGLKSIIEKYKEESGDKANNGHENEREQIDDRNKNGKNSKDGDTNKDNQSKSSDKDKNDGEKTMSNSPDDSDKNKNSSMNRKKTVSNSPDDDNKTKDGDETNDQNGDGNKNAARNSTGNNRPANTVKIRRRYNPFSLNQTKITTKLAELCRLLSASDKMNSFNYTNMSKLCTENENGLDDEVYGSNEQIEIGVPLYYGAQLID